MNHRLGDLGPLHGLRVEFAGRRDEGGLVVLVQGEPVVLQEGHPRLLVPPGGEEVGDRLLVPATRLVERVLRPRPQTETLRAPGQAPRSVSQGEVGLELPELPVLPVIELELLPEDDAHPDRDPDLAGEGGGPGDGQSEGGTSLGLGHVADQRKVGHGHVDIVDTDHPLLEGHQDGELGDDGDLKDGLLAEVLVRSEELDLVFLARPEAHSVHEEVTLLGPHE